MKIIVLKGSPNRHGSSNLLADNFIMGAKEAGHDVEDIDAAHANIKPCIGCLNCGYEGECALSDDMDVIREKIIGADMLVFATPLYYWGMTAQLKTLVDRFCSRNFTLQTRHLKSALLTVAYNSDDWTFDSLEAHYDTLVRYLNFDDCGRILGYACGSPSMTSNSKYPKDAYELGKSLK